MASLKAYAKWAGLGVDFLSDYLLPKPGRPRPHPISEGVAGVVRMCDAAPTPAHAALFAMQGLIGLRVSEARAIRPEHFDLVDMVLTVRGKGDRTRHVPISTRAWKYIEPAYNAALFGQRNVVPMADGTARQAIREIGKSLGFRRDISSHDLRATCATAMLDKTSNLRAVQEMLGHASVTTTETYTFVKMDTIRDGLEF